MATAMHKQFAWEETRDVGVVSVSTGDGDDARPRKRRKVANGVNRINYEPGMHPQNGTAKDERKASFAPFQSRNWKLADGGRDPPSSLEKSRKELPIFSGKQAILDAFQANDTIVILGEPGSGKTTR
jgi:HrpA-like RNA helicase